MQDLTTISPYHRYYNKQLIRYHKNVCKFQKLTGPTVFNITLALRAIFKILSLFATSAIIIGTFNKGTPVTKTLQWSFLYSRRLFVDVTCLFRYLVKSLIQFIFTSTGYSPRMTARELYHLLNHEGSSETSGSKNDKIVKLWVHFGAEEME